MFIPKPRRQGNPQRQLPEQLVPLHPLQPHPALLLLHCPLCPSLVLHTGCGCSSAGVRLGRGVRWTYFCSPAARPLCTIPCHRSPSGHWVAASLVAASEFRTADERRYYCQIYIIRIHFKKHGILTGFTGFTGC